MSTTNADHVYGFAAWLTTRPEAVTIGADHVGVELASLVKEYCAANNIAVSAEYPHTFVMPVAEVPA